MYLVHSGCPWWMNYGLILVVERAMSGFERKFGKESPV